MFKKTTLENGLRIITASMQGTNTVTVLVLCGTGSDYEAREIGGISHFLEHMFFKGTKNRPTPDHIKHELDGMGSISNAFTSHEITGYHIKAAKTYLDQSLDLLADIYKNSLLTDEEINHERQVIIEEMHKDRDT
ncbi:MAG: insulinase family protein, partial [Candidatus Sungiibacteriota bacterium]